MQDALNHFKLTDPTMHSLVLAMGHKYPERIPADQYFSKLIRSIVGQQLSVKAAATIRQRLIDMAGELTPENLLSLSHEQLRSVGMSNAKAIYVHEVSRAVLERDIILDTLHELEDMVVISELTKLKGIGPWSAEMFLMFSLGRPDVFSYGDQGLKNAIIIQYGQLSKTKLDRLISGWSPYRTTASFALWHSLDNAPK